MDRTIFLGSAEHGCSRPYDMENQGRQRQQGEERNLVDRWDALEPFYDVATPRWSAYYHKVRRTIKFPRYYKRVLNW